MSRRRSASSRCRRPDDPGRAFMAGTVISRRGSPKVSASPMHAARAPDAGEDYVAPGPEFPAPPANAGLVQSGVRSQRGGLPADFAGGVRRTGAHSTPQGRISTRCCLTNHRGGLAVQADPMRLEAGQTISPELERFSPIAWKACTIEVNAGHLSITHAREISSSYAGCQTQARFQIEPRLAATADHPAAVPKACPSP